MIETMFHLQNTVQHLKQADHILGRLMPVITPCGVLLGLLLGRHVAWMKPSVNWLFGFLTLTGALSISVNDIGKTLKRPSFLLVFLICANLLLPFIAWASSAICFPSDKDLRTGYMLLEATPSAVVGTVWSSIYGGNMAVSLTILLVDTLFAPLLVPLTMHIFTGQSVQMDTTGMMLSLVKMVVIPSIIGVAIHQATHGKVTKTVAPCLKPFSKVGLLLVVMINTSQIAEELIQYATWKYIPIALLCAGLAAVGFPIAYRFCRLFHFSHEDAISVTFASSLRNISAALVLAIEFFPPMTALPVILGIVSQQTICAIMASLLFGKKEKKDVYYTKESAK